MRVPNPLRVGGEMSGLPDSTHDSISFRTPLAVYFL